MYLCATAKATRGKFFSEKKECNCCFSAHFFKIEIEAGGGGLDVLEFQVTKGTNLIS
jgi:hypothetical protein